MVDKQFKKHDKGSHHHQYLFLPNKWKKSAEQPQFAGHKNMKILLINKSCQ